ncbi:MAG: DksA/TraR family C4-type zinc finger protein [Gammaproteobacteria bacterium]
MAGGWSKDGAIQDQIDASVDDAVKAARSRLGQGKSLESCEDCGEEIAKARREAVPGVRRCIQCQEAVDKLSDQRSLFNRRGSKDSQLR